MTDERTYKSAGVDVVAANAFIRDHVFTSMLSTWRDGAWGLPAGPDSQPWKYTSYDDGEAQYVRWKFNKRVRIFGVKVHVTACTPWIKHPRLWFRK